MLTVNTYPIPVPEFHWEVIAKAVTLEPKIDSTRNTPENLAELYRSSLAVVLVSSGEPVGFIAAWPVEDKFVEIGSIWIREDHRGMGHSHKLYRAVASLRGIIDKVAFGVTTNAISVYVGKSVGLTIVEDWNNPVPMHLTCGPCENVAAEDQASCPARGVTCWMRILINK